MKQKEELRSLIAFFIILIIILSAIYIIQEKPITSNIIKTNYQQKEVPINKAVTKYLLEQNINNNKNYLLKMMDPNLHGVHKYYYPEDDTFEPRLHTIYTSSTLLSLLKYQEYQKENQLTNHIQKSTIFILSMQNLNKSSKYFGAFHYSYYLETKVIEKRFVVGTTSKTIFTLLELYQKTNNITYLNSATSAADWLITMIKKDGNVKPYIELEDNGKYVHSTKNSQLYNGQVLSALSRTYKITNNQKYKTAANKIAIYFQNEIKKQGCYLKDDYRKRNPISSSWAILSLLDYYKISNDKKIKQLIIKCSDELLAKQLTNPKKSNFGRWQDSFSSSGNGWLAEVYVEIYNFCKKENLNNCNKYKTAIINSIGWNQQHIYTNNNTKNLPNPQRAIGGIYWNKDNKYVRTDSVAHGMNAFIGIINGL